MKIRKQSIMPSSLSYWTLALVVLALSGSMNPAASSPAVVHVTITVGTYLDVEFVSASLGMNPVISDEFYISDPEQQSVHTAMSQINVRTNVTCSLRTRQNIILTHAEFGAPTVPVTAQILFAGQNPAYRKWYFGQLYWVLNYMPGLHLGTTFISVSVQQEWTVEHLAGLYTGTVTVELLEGIL